MVLSLSLFDFTACNTLHKICKNTSLVLANTILHISRCTCSYIHKVILIIAARKVNKNGKRGQPGNNAASKATSKEPGTSGRINRSNSTRTVTKPSSGSRTLPRSNSVRHSSEGVKPGTKTERSIQTKSQTLPRPKKTVQGTKSADRPSNINLAAGPGPRKMGKSVKHQQGPGTSMRHGVWHAR